jgi:hypothetical protein
MSRVLLSLRDANFEPSYFDRCLAYAGLELAPASDASTHNLSGFWEPLRPGVLLCGFRSFRFRRLPRTWCAAFTVDLDLTPTVIHIYSSWRCSDLTDTETSPTTNLGVCGIPVSSSQMHA